MQEILCLTDTQMGQIKTITDGFRLSSQAVLCDTSLTETEKEAKIKVLKIEKLSRVNTCLTKRQQAMYKTMKDPNDELSATSGSPVVACLNGANLCNATK